MTQKCHLNVIPQKTFLDLRVGGVAFLATNDTKMALKCHQQMTFLDLKVSFLAINDTKMTLKCHPKE